MAALPLPFVLCLFPSPRVGTPAWRRCSDAWPTGSPTAALIANPRLGGGSVSAPFLDLEIQAAAYPTPASQPSPSPSLLLLPAKHWHAHRL